MIGAFVGETSERAGRQVQLIEVVGRGLDLDNRAALVRHERRMTWERAHRDRQRSLPAFPIDPYEHSLQVGVTRRNPRQGAVPGEIEKANEFLRLTRIAAAARKGVPDTRRRSASNATATRSAWRT